MKWIPQRGARLAVRLRKPPWDTLTDLNIADYLCAVVYERRGCHAREARAMGPEHRRKLYVEQVLWSVA